MESTFEIEQVDLDFRDFEEVHRMCGKAQKYAFPTIYVGREICYFNRAAVELVPEYFKWRVNDEWCVLVPSTRSEKNSYKTRHASETCMKICRFPSEIKTSTLMRGVHKLYKTGNCLCFKRYELLDDRNRGETDA